MAQGWSKQCSAAHSGPVTHGRNLCYYLHIAAERGGAGRAGNYTEKRHSDGVKCAAQDGAGREVI